MAALAFPNIDPILLRLGPFQVHWYGLAYVVGFLAAGLIMRSRARRWGLGLSDDDIIELVLAAVIGVIVGSRLGYVIFYGGADYWRHPLTIFAVWDGGMSFHGGLAGILIACAIEARRHNLTFLQLADVGAVGAPIGFGLGRLANFINGELWGRVTDVPWAVLFPGAGPQGRHPSQLYEAFLEGVLLFTVLLILSRRRRPEGLIFGMLLLLYGTFRFGVEFFRQPDPQLGFIAAWMTMGQILSIPLVLIGGWLVIRALRVGRAQPEEVSAKGASRRA
jgi:phosphatidylglycerol:prolipoprotein diacylglycerol transferase